MRPEGVVFPAVVLDDHSGFGESPELLPVKAFIAESSVEALHIAVLPRAAGFDVDRLNPVLGEPLLHRLGDELAPVVASQEGGCPMFLDGLAHPLQNVSALECSISPQYMALAGILVEDREHPQCPASRGSITDEVPGPDMALVLGLHGQSRRVTSADHLPLGRWHPQSQRSPHALDASLAHMPSLLSKQGSDTAVAVSGMLVAKFNHSLQESLLPRGLLLRAIPIT